MMNTNKILMGIILISSLFSGFLVYNVPDAAAAQEKEKVEVNGDVIQTQLQARHEIRYRFGDTKITVSSERAGNLSIEVQKKKIGDKDFEIEIETDKDCNLTIECKEEEAQKGLELGNTVRVRNRVRHRYQEGFVAKIDCTEDCEAKLRIEEDEENRGGTWAYYDKDDEEWIPVETKSENGYLECKTDHFSTWTILVPEIDYTLITFIGIGVGAAVLVGVAFFIIRRKKR